MFNYKNHINETYIYKKINLVNKTYNKIELFYKRDKINKKIIVQTPPMFALFDIKSKIFNNNEYFTLCLSFSKKDVNKSVNDFYKFIQYIDKLNNTLAKTKRKKFFNGKKLQYKSLLRTYGGFPQFLTLNLPIKDEKFLFDIYDEQLNKIKISEITRNSEISVILEFSELWFNNTFIGCNCNVLQIKKYNTLVFDRCLIIDEESDEEIKKVVDNSKYEKYFKMLKMGIPVIAVKNNMIKDNLGIEFINSLPDDINEFKDKLNSNNNNSNSNNSNNFIPIKINPFALLDAKNLLKKPELGIGLKKNIKKKDGYAPSLDDINNILNKFKKKKEQENTSLSSSE
jgi:hypothetical protein